MARKFILTIGREYGSDGRLIGKRVAELMGVTFYDSQLITMAAKESGMSQSLLTDIDEKAANSLMYSLSVGSGHFMGFSGAFNMPLNDKLFLVQADIIKDIAEKESAVIVGRCADYVLRENEDVVNIFIYAPYDKRKENVAERFGISLDKAADMIVKKEKQRKNYYNYYSGAKWGTRSNYHLCIDSTLMGVEGTAQFIADILNKR